MIDATKALVEQSQQQLGNHSVQPWQLNTKEYDK